MSSAHSGPRHKGFEPPFYSNIVELSHALPGVHLSFRPMAISFVVAVGIFSVLEPQQSIYNFEMVLFLLPLWLPYILYRSAVARYAQYKRAEAMAGQDYTLLEIKIPRDTTKTPAAMEAFFSNLHIGSGETNWYKTFVQGGTRPLWSAEIVSLGGRLHFYIRTRTGYRRLVESFLYAQYPDVEIIEAEDYSLLVDPSEHGYGMFACEFGFPSTISSPHPIKTYVDFGIEPGDKPEETVDPLAQLLETMSNIGPQEQFWIQIIFRMQKKEKYEGLINKEGKPYGWSDEITDALDGIRSQTVREIVRVDPVTGVTTKSETFPNPTKSQTEMLAAIARKANKQIFDVGIRAVYLAPDEAFQGIMIPGMLAMFKPFNNENLGNKLGPLSKWSAYFQDFPWEDRSGHHKHELHKMAIQMYRRREYFNYPYVGPWINLSTEELATLFHVPSAAVTTPNIERIQSSTSSAPANLPS